MALDHQRPGALEKRGRELAGRRRAHPCEERAQERLRVAVVPQSRELRASYASTTGFPRATRRQGGSITVSERMRSGRSAAAKSAITPPYEWPTRCVPGSTN